MKKRSVLLALLLLAFASQALAFGVDYKGHNPSPCIEKKLIRKAGGQPDSALIEACRLRRSAYTNWGAGRGTKPGDTGGQSSLLYLSWIEQQTELTENLSAE